MKRKTIVAVTGKIGSGKSVVGKYLQQKGYVVADCDVLARQVANLPAVLAQVEGLLGGQSVVDGALNRSWIREKVFADSQLLKKYNEIFHGEVKQMLIDICQNNDVVFVELPPVNGFVFPFTHTILVNTPPSVALSRACKRDGVTAQNVERVANSQAEVTNADFVLNNNGTLQQLYCQVDCVLQQLGIA